MNCEMPNGEMVNSPAFGEDLSNGDMRPRGRQINGFRQQVIRHVLENTRYQCNCSNNFDIQIIQNESRKCSRKFGNMRWLGLTNNVMLCYEERLACKRASQLLVSVKRILKKIFRQQSINHALDNQGFSNNRDLTFDTQIIQNESRKCFRKLLGIGACGHASLCRSMQSARLERLSWKFVLRKFVLEKRFLRFGKRNDEETFFTKQFIPTKLSCSIINIFSRAFQWTAFSKLFFQR